MLLVVYEMPFQAIFFLCFFLLIDVTGLFWNAVTVIRLFVRFFLLTDATTWFWNNPESNSVYSMVLYINWYYWFILQCCVGDLVIFTFLFIKAPSDFVFSADCVEFTPGCWKLNLFLIDWFPEKLQYCKKVHSL